MIECGTVPADRYRWEPRQAVWSVMDFAKLPGPTKRQFRGQRKSSETVETCRLRRGEGCGACSDETWGKGPV